MKALPQASVAVATAKTGVAGQRWCWERQGCDHRRGGVHDVDGLAGRAAVAAGVGRRPGARHAYEPAQAPLVLTSAKVSVKALPQASVAVATANTGVAGQEIVLGAGRAAITGAVLS